jgi:hypothetical protein
MNDIETLRETERACIAKFRTKAQQLRAANPQLSMSAAMSQAYESLPRTTNQYLYTRSLLAQMGVAALPLH